MPIRTRFLSTAFLPLALLSVNSASAAVPVSKDHVAPLIQKEGHDLGQESLSTILHLTAGLNLYNRADLDARVAALYAPDSPTYHQWLTPAELKSFGSTEAELAAVKQELAAHNLAITAVDPWNLSVRFSGKTSDVEAAFHTTIRRVQVRSEVVRTSSSLPALSGAAAGLVSHLAGLGSVSMRSMARRPLDPRTFKPFAGHAVARDARPNARPNASEFSSQCFFAPATVNLSGLDYDTASISESATYTGLTYGADPANTAKGTLSPCGYSPSDLARIYGLAPVYAEGITGKGQTIVLVDPFLEPYIQGDMDTFSSLEGLPDVTINVINPYNAIYDGTVENWSQEADLDVEVAHAIAPAAGIASISASSTRTRRQVSFGGGSGGGTSVYFTKPSYQAYLPGTGRLLPDVSALADPFTGVQVVYSQDGINEYTLTVGGTSVSTPLFSAIWSLVDEAYGKSAGFAAPLIAEYANSPFISDVVPYTGPANVTGSVTSPSGTTTYSATDLVVPLYSTTQFASAIWNTDANEFAVISFGTDTSLTVTDGWDNVTGYGTPNLADFSEVLSKLK